MRSFVATLTCLLTLVPFRAPAEEPIFAPGAALKIEAGKGAGGEGPAWHPKLGVLSSGNGHIYRLDHTGQSSIFRKGAGTNGLLFDARGRLLACEPVLRRVTRTEPDGTVSVLTDRYEGKRYNQPNDLTVDSHGRIYFTDPRYGSREGMEIRDDQGRTIEGVYRIDPDGTVTRIIGRELERPNGVLVTADDRFLYVADNNNDTVGGARKLYRFDLRKDGSVDLASRKLLYDWGQGRGPDGLKQDQLGRLYVAGGLNKPNPPFEPAADKKGGLYVLSPEGKLLAFLPVPTDEVTNCAFGGDDLKTLYITAGGTLYSIRTTVPGRVVWPTVAGDKKVGARSKFTGPWDLAALRQPPKVTSVDQSKTMTSLYYEGEPYRGKPTRIFAYLARPEKAQGKVPAMMLVHGGGGTAFQEWAELWAKRGYVALAMDLAGQGPDRKRLPDGGPGQDIKAKFEADEVKDFWTYHAVANVIRGVSLLANLPEVDAGRIGVTGISWGGYLTCLVAGLDDRLKVAVPVYGCGFIHENSAWLHLFAKMTAEKRQLWVEHFEPSCYLGQAKMPVLFVNGTNDSAYPLDSYQKSYRLVKDRTVCVTVNLPHSHPAGWAPAEIGLFVDQYLRGGKPLARVEAVKRDANRVEVKFRAEVPVAKAALHYTTDSGAWKERKWHTQEAKVDGTTVRADLPAARPLAYFLTLTDDRKVTVSTEHEILSGPPEGFESVFNGRDLTGWEGSPKDWKVEDGCLTGTTDGTLKHNRFLVWRGGKVRNFELRVQVKVSPGGNSGINYRSTERPDLGECVVTGYQCDVVANRADYNGMLYEERGRRILARTGEKVVIDREGQPWVVGELPLKEFKAGEWHEYRVLVRGNYHQHWIDGHQTVDVIDLDEKGRKLEGVLAVQVHVGPAMKIQYRDFFLKRLPDDLPLVTPEQAKIPASARKVVPQGKDKPKKPTPG